MVGTITPVGGRSANAVLTASLTGIVYLTGTVIGALVAGFLFGIIGELAQAAVGRLPLWFFAAGVTLIAAGADTIQPPLSLPSLRRQVPAYWWLRHSRYFAAWLSGFHIGCGLLTFVVWSGFYVVLAGSVLLGFPLSLIVVGVYGAVRGIQPLYAVLFMYIQPTSSATIIERHIHWLSDSLARRLSRLALFIATPIALVVILAG